MLCSQPVLPPATIDDRPGTGLPALPYEGGGVFGEQNAALA